MDPYCAQLLAKLTGKGPPKPHLSTAVNVWRKTQRELIENRTLQLAATRGADSKRLLAIRDEVARDLFNRFDEETKAFWKRKAEEEHALAVESWKKKLDAEVPTDPADRQKIIQELATLMQPLLDMVSQATGMKGTMLMGGPEPAGPIVDNSLGPSPVKKKSSMSNGSDRTRIPYAGSQPKQNGSSQGASSSAHGTKMCPPPLDEPDYDLIHHFPYDMDASLLPEAPIAGQPDALTYISSAVDLTDETVNSASLRKGKEVASNLKRKKDQPIIEGLTDDHSDFAEEEEQMPSKRTRIEEPDSNWFSQALTMLGQGLGIL